MALIEDCSCGEDHETMPMVDVSTCMCLISELAGKPDLVDPDCTHEEVLMPGVCVTHKRHEPCRPCMREEGFRGGSAR